MAAIVVGVLLFALGLIWYALAMAGEVNKPALGIILAAVGLCIMLFANAP